VNKETIALRKEMYEGLSNLVPEDRIRVAGELALLLGLDLLLEFSELNKQVKALKKAVEDLHV
jgi:hypothetical protein